MSHCDGRLFDGSACNNNLMSCVDCGALGCTGDGCDNQAFGAESCDCGAPLASRPAGLVAA